MANEDGVRTDKVQKCVLNVLQTDTGALHILLRHTRESKDEIKYMTISREREMGGGTAWRVSLVMSTAVGVCTWCCNQWPRIQAGQRCHRWPARRNWPQSLLPAPVPELYNTEKDEEQNELSKKLKNYMRNIKNMLCCGLSKYCNKMHFSVFYKLQITVQYFLI